MPSQKYIDPVRPLSVEICGNKIDDDGNGLVDDKDFACFFTPSNTLSCRSNKIIWGCSDFGLHWADTETGVERLVGNMNNNLMDDITWASNGKLYGIDHFFGGIWEIDPNTSDTKFLTYITGYYAANGMTSDGEGNLYLSAFQTNGANHVVRLNLATFEVTLVADLSAANLTSGGDLTFLDGTLYVACRYSKLAKINMRRGSVKTYVLGNAPDTDPYGLITFGDGFLYLSYNNEIYKLDLATMQVNSTPYYVFVHPKAAYLRGLSNYSEQCNSPICRPDITISVPPSPIYCSNTGVLLRAKGIGIMGDHGYTWTLPNGTTVSNDSLLVTESGRYYARYHSVPDTCGKVDSIDITVARPPFVGFAENAILCKGSALNLVPYYEGVNATYLWQDGSTLPYFKVVEPGRYWLKVSNGCGSSIDTIVVNAGVFPHVDLGPDISICPGTSITLRNYSVKQPGDIYQWSNTSTADSIPVTSGGLYWLKSSNTCDTERDSIVINIKDSCTCFPLYPSVELGESRELCPYDTLVLRNERHQDGFRYRWQDGTVSPYFIVKAPGKYQVDVITYCETTKDSILVMPKLQGCERKVYVPSAFSPNGDSKNDLFKPVVLGDVKQFEFIVYNRWGQIVFRTLDKEKGWDGELLGKAQASSSYVWVCNYRFEGESLKTKKGNVMLIR